MSGPLSSEAEAAGTHNAHPAYLAACEGRLGDQLRRLAPLGAGLHFALAGVGYASGASRPAAGLLLIGAAFALLYPITQSAWVRAHPHVPLLGIAALAAVGAANLAAAGRVEQAPGWSILLVCWGVAATQLSVSTRALVVGISVQIAVFAATALGLRSDIRPPAPHLWYAIMLCGAVLAVVGSRERHRADAALFGEEAHLRRRRRELRQREREIAAHERDLEGTVARQVDELVAGAEIMERLGTQLGEGVRHRSRRLAEEVDRISALPAESAPPHADEVRDSPGLGGPPRDGRDR